MTDRVVNLKHYKRGTGRNCMHCGRRATWIGERAGTHRLQVRYCDAHKEEIRPSKEKTQ